MHVYCFMIDLTFKVLFGPDGNFYLQVGHREQ